MAREVFERVRASRVAALEAEVAALPLPSATPLVFEIGCGNGHFLAAYGAAHPHTLCVGVDLRLERIHKALRKCRRARLENVFFLRGEARDLLHVLPAPLRLREIYLLFPDPWPKKRHHKHRLLQRPLLDELAARALPGTRLYFRTDFTPYFEEAAATVNAHPAWRLLPAGPMPFEHPTVFQARAPHFHSLAAEFAPATACGPRSE